MSDYYLRCYGRGKGAFYLVHTDKCKIPDRKPKNYLRLTGCRNAHDAVQQAQKQRDRYYKNKFCSPARAAKCCN